MLLYRPSRQLLGTRVAGVEYPKPGDEKGEVVFVVETSVAEDTDAKGAGAAAVTAAAAASAAASAARQRRYQTGTVTRHRFGEFEALLDELRADPGWDRHCR